MTEIPLHPAQLFHIGVVAEDIDKAMAEMSQALGLTWKGGQPQTMSLCIFGEERRVEMRIAHSVQGPPHVELIQAIPDSPWATPTAVGAHHLCYWSDRPQEAIAALKAAGATRALGKPDAASGYFRTPSGMYVEVIGPELRAQLSGWIRGELTRRRPSSPAAA
jgi:hypothetical protein